MQKGGGREGWRALPPFCIQSGGEPKMSGFFSFSTANFVLSLSGGLLVEFVAAGSRPWPTQFAFGLLWGHFVQAPSLCILRRTGDSCTNIHGTSRPWSSTPMKALCSWADTTVTRCDMCMFGDGTWHRVGNRWVKRPSQLRTGWEPAFQNRLTRCQPLATAGIFTQAGQQGRLSDTHWQQQHSKHFDVT